MEIVMKRVWTAAFTWKLHKNVKDLWTVDLYG
jgi:hypothetical protein